MVDHVDSALVRGASERAEGGRGVSARPSAETTFEEIVGEHQDRVRQLVSRLLAWSADAEDVVQEVFLVVLTKLASFQGRSNLSTWLTRIALNKCRQHRRRLSVHLRALSGLQARRAWEASAPAGAAMDRETAERIRKAVADLPQKYREAVVLRHLQGLSGPEMAKVVGISTAAADARLGRARARLRKALADLEED